MKQNRCLFILSALAISFVLFCCTLEEPAQASTKKTVLPDQTATSVNLIYSEEGIIKVKLTAPTLIIKERKTEQINEFPDGLVMHFFNKNGEKNADLYANYGYDNVRKKERFAKDSVRIITVDGATYSTNELYIDEKKDTIHNNGKYVKITDKDGTFVQGEGFTADSRMEKIRIEKILPSTLPINDENKPPKLLN